jgi:hypothetical protein
MASLKIEQTVTKDGEICITGLPYKIGETIDIILSPHESDAISRKGITVGEFRRSGLIGMWKDRTDIEDSTKYAQILREQAQNRR